MAAWGEGDSRWIVQNRPEDGQNVNQWHWSEKDCLGWARQRLVELFDSVVLLDNPDVIAKIVKVESVEGEAFLNVRKKKLIPSYELKASFSFEATVRSQDDGAKAITGKVVLPYLAEENHDEDPEVLIIPNSDDSQARSLKTAIFERRAETIYPRVRTWVDEFHAGTPAGHVDAPASKPVVKDHSAAASSTANMHKWSSDGAPAKAGLGNEAIVRGSHQITMKETFYASAMDLYEALTSESRVRAYTQSEATVATEPGGIFSLFGGSVQGYQRELVPGKRIVQDWRFSTWPDHVYSQVVLDIDEKEPGNTEVTLVQRGIPSEDKFGNHDVLGNTEHGWRNLIFLRIRQVFGYGV